MVFLTAAAATAGAYGAYKGGEAAVKKTKQTVRDVKLSRNAGDKPQYEHKKKERQERISQITKKHQDASSAGGVSIMSSFSSAGADDGAGSGENGAKSVDERLKERRSLRASGAGTGFNSSTIGKSKKSGSVLSRFTSKKK